MSGGRFTATSLTSRTAFPKDWSTPVWVACGSGYRAFAASAFLEAAGLQLIVVTPGGIPDVLERLSQLTA